MMVGTLAKTLSVASVSNRPEERDSALRTPRLTASGTPFAADFLASIRASARVRAKCGKSNAIMLAVPSTTVAIILRMSLN
ncbi:hypothetical protein E2C01_025848 [Portunus trituberculatus]|uniref:Uncharacterized protein n=1 Tax=Portunus trituberculatus TaxID=210409 RepID=A0A5B7EH89_PORTR|nr:hypothetical protein [Portunus trituberculatus]